MTVKESSLNTNNGLKSFALLAALFLLLSWFRLDPGSEGSSNLTAGTTNNRLAETDETVDDVVGPEGSQDPSAVTGDDTTTQRGTGPRPGLECKPGRNGGATDKGVSAGKINLATTAVLDGAARSLLEDSVTGMKAVIDKVNKSGGICGRLLDLRVVNDSFDKARGQAIIKNFIAEDVFALPVVPSAEGLGAAILSSDIKKAGIPVVGTDGLRQEQYNDPWVWPVASATVTAMRVMAKYGATTRQAKTFGIVWDDKYQFGREGADAFKDQVRKMGHKVVADRSLDPARVSYSNEAKQFSDDCAAAGGCEMVAMLLLPDTAKQWLVKRPAMGTKYTAGAQTLFTDRFAQDCVLQIGDQCNGFAVWTGYNPPIGPLATLPGVASYKNDVIALKPSIDVNNQFVEGAYLGMSLFVDALRKVGPDLTRARLQAELDATDLKTDLASQLSWRPNKHAANVRSQSFSMSVNQGAFRGWSNENTGFLLDPAHGG